MTVTEDTGVSRLKAFLKITLQSGLLAGLFVFGPYAVGMSFQNATVATLLMVAFHTISNQAKENYGF